MVKINCIETLNIPHKILLRTGLWPSIENTKWDVVKLIFNFVFDLVLLGLLILNIENAMKFNNAKKLNTMTCLLISCVNYMAKSFTLVINKNCFFSLLNDLRKKEFNRHKQELNKDIRVFYKFSKLILRYFAFGYTTYVIAVGLMPILINMPMMLPAPFETGRLDIVYKVLHFFAVVDLAFNSACLDMLFLILIGLCVVQLNILTKKLTYILEDTKEVYGNSEKINSSTERNLKESIILHELINQYSEKLNILLSFPLFIQYTCGCIIICNSVLQLTIMVEGQSTNSFITCAYFSVTIGQMTAYHWIGNEVIFKSNKIIESCYISRWYQLNIKSQKSLLLLMERAKRPLIIKLYNFVFISLDSLGVIVRWAYSVFAVMKARYS